MKESGGIEWRHVAVPILAMICFFFIWALIPLYGAGHLLIGIGLPSAAAWIVAGFAIRRGFVGRGSYGAVWGVYALAGAVFWEIVWDCYPIIFFWKPLMCEVFQGPASQLHRSAIFARENLLDAFWLRADTVASFRIERPGIRYTKLPPGLTRQTFHLRRTRSDHMDTLAAQRR